MLPTFLLLAGMLVAQAQSQQTLQPFRRIGVLGERHSGTNYVEKILQSNFPGYEYDTIDGFFSATYTPERIWAKHCYAFPTWPNASQGAPVPEDIAALNLAPGQMPNAKLERFGNALAIVVLRNPYDWAVSMSKHCWCEESAWLKDLSFEDKFDEAVVDGCVQTGEGGRPIDSPGRCTNFLQCRGAKYRSWLAMGSWAPNVEYVRYEDIANEAQAMSWLGMVKAKYQLAQASRTLRNVYTYTSPLRPEGSRFSLSAAKETSLFWHPEQLAINETLRNIVRVVNQRMDTEVERLAGYEPINLDVVPRKLAGAASSPKPCHGSWRRLGLC